jgi:hypothetical protein
MAIVWVGGAIAMQLLASRVQRVGTRAQLVEMTGHIEFVATRLFIPASLILLVLGIWMVSIRWSFGQIWIILGIGMFPTRSSPARSTCSPQMRKVKTVVEREAGLGRGRRAGRPDLPRVPDKAGVPGADRARHGAEAVSLGERPVG